MAITASEARSRLFPLIQQVNDDHVPVRISSRGGDAVLMSAADFKRASAERTTYLQAYAPVPANFPRSVFLNRASFPLVWISRKIAE